MATAATACSTRAILIAVDPAGPTLPPQPGTPFPCPPPVPLTPPGHGRWDMSVVCVHNIPPQPENASGEGWTDRERGEKVATANQMQIASR